MLALPHGAAATGAIACVAADAGQRVAWQKRRQVRRHADGPHAGAAAAVRNRERLVQVQVADVGADRGGAGQPHLRVHVRAVHVDLAAVLVHDGADLADRLFVDAVRRRIGHHQRGQVVAMGLGLGPQVRDVHVPARVGGDDDHVHSGHDRAGRIGAVRRAGDEHHRAVRLARGSDARRE